MIKKVLNDFLNKNLEGKEKKFNDIKLIEIIISIIFIAFGIIILFNKTTNDSFAAIFLGIIILLEAILNIYSSIMHNSNKIFKINIVFGIIYIIIALLLFTNLIKFVNYISIYYSVYLIINGLKQLINSIRYKLIKEDSWLIIIVMAILIISLGVLLMFYPFESFEYLETIAIFSILSGLLNINTSNLLRNRTEKILSKVDNN